MIPKQETYAARALYHINRVKEMNFEDRAVVGTHLIRAKDWLDDGSDTFAQLLDDCDDSE